MEASVECTESCDRIGDLPDNVLHHVLSFLPIKDVIRTSFISTRWRCLWTSVPTLNFDGLVFSPKTKFMTFVDSVLNRRDNCAVQTFCLRFGNYYCSGDCVHAWVCDAIGHSVRELSLSSHTVMPFKLPERVFTCKSLTVLTLSLDNSTLILPPSVRLPSLKTLQLVSLTFADENVNQLFSNCNALENVLIEDCELSSTKVFHISSTSVRRLIIDCIPKDSSFHTRVLGSEVRISMPKLISFEYNNSFPQKVSLENSSSLANAFIYTGAAGASMSDYGPHGRSYCTNVIDLLGCLATVEVLKLSLSSELLSAKYSLSLACLPIFSKLKHLKLSAEANSDGISQVACFLDISPSLELLSVELCHHRRFFAFNSQDSGCEVDEFKINDIRGLKANPEFCHLKIINIRGFVGKKQEVVFVKYLLEHAFNLERITIVSSKNFSKNLKWKMKIEEDILMHERGSVSSKVVFESLN